MLVFKERGKTEYSGKNLSEQRRDHQQTQPIYSVDTGIWTRASLMGGESSHRCATTAPLLCHQCTTTAPPSVIRATIKTIRCRAKTVPSPFVVLKPWVLFVDQTSDVLLCRLAALYLIAVTLPCFLSGITWRSWNAWQQWKTRHGGTINSAPKNDCFYSRAYLLTAPFLCHVIGS